MNMVLTRADQARSATSRAGHLKRAAQLRMQVQQRKFELAVDAEVRASIEDLFLQHCEAPIKEAVSEGKSSVMVDIPTYFGDEQPAPQEYWWKPGVRCKAILKHLRVYLRQQGFSVQEGEYHLNRNPRGHQRGRPGLHAVPLFISW